MFFRPLLLAAGFVFAVSPALAQSNSEMQLRINRLEEQVRQLTGQNEEYQHQIRQLQQQLPQGGGAPAPQASGANRQPLPSVGPNAGARPPQQYPGAQVGSSDPNIAAPGPQDLGALPAGPGGSPLETAPVTGGPAPQPSEPGAPMVIAPDFQNQPDGSSLPGVDFSQEQPPGAQPPHRGAPATATASGSPEEEYALGAGFLQRKDWEFAETQFQGFIRQFPNDARVPDALYGLGESYYQRKSYSDAIEPFLEVVTKYAQSPRAADSMLRLGQTLGAIDQKEQACATLQELGNKYPRSNAKAQSTREMSRLGC